MANQRPNQDAKLDDYYDLGSHHRPISTSKVEAQLWFDRGLIWSFGFNHEESVKCFERAVAADPDCAIAYWGIAYSLGPNYNKPWNVFDEEELQQTIDRAWEVLKLARQKAAGPGMKCTPAEHALIDALQYRYPKKAAKPKKGSALDHGYAQAMAKVYRQFSSDLDVAALYADALMNLTPWRLWDQMTGEPAKGAQTLEAKRVLEQSLAQDPYHPGLLHLYIHLMEMSSHPEVALRLADNLRGLVPDAGHLNHMPTHLDVICGDYRRGISSNSQAIVSDEKWVSKEGRDGALNFYALYRCHNYHFRIYAAMFAGQYKVALETASQLEAALPESLLRVKSPPMADWLEGFLAMRVHVLVRFGRWQDIVALVPPQDAELYCTTVAMIHYAKGVALANTSRLEEAERHRDLFSEAVKRVPPSRTVFNNTCRDILAIAAAMLDGELEFRKGNVELGFERLRDAIRLDDNLPYDEPWGWMQPTRHAYGALLLEQGRVEDAAAVYRADLGLDDTLPRSLQHRNNVWALHGYHECLVMLGRKDEARLLQNQLELAVACADVPIRSSCFCRSRL